MSPVGNLKGCQINFPETIFMYEDTSEKLIGKVQFLALNDKDGCLKQVTDQEQLRIYK